MRNRELIGPRDVVNCVLGALFLTLLACGIPYFAAGGPMPSVSMAIMRSAQKPVVAQQLNGYRAPSAPIVQKRTTAAIAAWPKAYQVLQGDSLSKIARSLYHNANAWTVIYNANRQQIRYPDLIRIGQNLTIPALPTHIPAPPAVTAPSSPRPHTDVVTVSQPPQQNVEQAAPVHAATSVPSNGFAVSSAFQACVIRAESGGNPQIWNASGHWGLYQFSASTWAAHGGNPSDFGHAGAAEQTQIFWNTVRADGTSDWAPYDGC